MKEVWRLVSDDPEIRAPEPYQVVIESQPDAFQLNPEHIFLNSPRHRIQFVPHALLRPPNDIPTRAFRLAFPTLLAAAADSLLFWDVRTGELVERMDFIQLQMPIPLGSAESSTSSPPPHPPESIMTGILGDICYVDLNDKYAFVCGVQPVKVFRRQHTPTTPPTTTSQQPSSSSSTQNPIEPNTRANCVMALINSSLQRRGKWYFRVGYVDEEDLPIGFRDWKSRKSNSREVYLAESDEVDIAPFTYFQQGEFVGTIESESESEDEDEVVVGEGGGRDSAWRRRRRNRRGNKLIRPVPGMWRNQDKVVVKHKMAMSTASVLIPVYHEHRQRCLAGESIKQSLTPPHNLINSSVHVSPCGQHLAILARWSRLLIIPYFERVIDGRVKDIHEIMIDIHLNARVESVYLAYENGRIGVVTVRSLFHHYKSQLLTHLCISTLVFTSSNQHSHPQTISKHLQNFTFKE